MRRFPLLNIVLFGLTFVSTMLVGAYHEGVIVFERWYWMTVSSPADLLKGLPFSLTLLGILLVHEFAHYAASRRHGVEATLPFFIPAPTQFGTLGAVIKMKSPITTRNALMDIGASGPIAGFLVSVVATVVGLSRSAVVPAKEIGEPFVYGGSLLYYWLIGIVLGPLPEDVMLNLHSVAFAGWIGLFITSINLLPVGQLDGGHIVFALLGERHTLLSRGVVLVLLLLGLLFPGWIVWAVLLVLLGLRHPPVIQREIALDRNRKIIGILALVIFVLTFTPVPMVVLQ